MLAAVAAVAVVVAVAGVAAVAALAAVVLAVMVVVAALVVPVGGHTRGHALFRGGWALQPDGAPVETDP